MGLHKNVWLLVASLILSACSGLGRDIANETVSEPGTTMAPPTLTFKTGDYPGGATEFSTDFSIHSVPYEEILSGGPPKDGIPAIDNPHFISVEEADDWLKSLEPVIQIQVGDEARAYPIQVLIWHEIVNDQIGALPIVVTFCPLCNTAIAFERTVNGQVLDFGTTGRLRFSNLIMYDRQTETWWQQAGGEAIAGELTGTNLEGYPALIVAWQDFRDAFPNGRVLSKNTGYVRDYGSNPYTGYDDIDSSPFLFVGPLTPGAMPPMARVLTIELNNEAIAFPYETMAEIGVANETVGGEPVVVFWQAGVASPLDTVNIGQGRDVGTAAAFSPRLGNERLTFSYSSGDIRDDQTGSNWDIFGRAVQGELIGSQLVPVVSINHFWFSWAAFRPDTRIFVPDFFQ